MSLPNPLLPGFNPDPSVCRVGDDYFIVTSTFEYVPALPVYHSRNLVDWQHIGNISYDAPAIGVAECPTNMGVWAPTIRHWDGVFHVVVVVAGHGCLHFTAHDPAVRGALRSSSPASEASIPTWPGETTAPPTSRTRV